jgi:response regulator RpfG family c-di-GMP phosphodiesterase
MARDSYGYFILLTSKADKEDVTRGFDAGADDFLSKPVNATGAARADPRGGTRAGHGSRKLHEKERADFPRWTNCRGFMTGSNPTCRKRASFSNH